MSEFVLVALIDDDPAYQLRASTDQAWVDEMAVALTEDGSLNLPAIDVWEVPGQERRKVVDGFHRLSAYIKAGRRSIPANIHDGSEESAFRFALLANRTHGLRLTIADKRRKATAALARWPERSSRELARETGLSHTFYDELRRRAKVEAERASAASAQDEARSAREAQLVHEVEAEAAKVSLAGVRTVELAGVGVVAVAELAADGRRVIPGDASAGSAGTYLYMAARALAALRASPPPPADPDARSAAFMRGRNDFLTGEAPRGESEDYALGYQDAQEMVAKNPTVIRPVKTACSPGEQIAQMQAAQRTLDVVDELIAEGEARAPGFAARAEDALRRRLLSRERSPALQRLREWCADNSWIGRAMPEDVVIVVSNAEGTAHFVVADGDPESDVGDHLDALGGILHSLLGECLHD